MNLVLGLFSNIFLSQNPIGTDYVDAPCTYCNSGDKTKNYHYSEVVHNSALLENTYGKRFKLAPKGGFEPPTSALTARRDYQLCYLGIKLFVFLDQSNCFQLITFNHSECMRKPFPFRAIFICLISFDFYVLIFII